MRASFAGKYGPLLHASCAAALLAAAGAARGEEPRASDEGVRLQEIVVTAQRRETNLQTTAASVAATEPLLDMLEQHLSTHPFMAGERFTMADIPVGCELHRWWGLPQERPARPALERWYRTVSTRAGARGVLDQPLA